MIKGFNTQQQQIQTVFEENMSYLTSSASGEQQHQQAVSVSSENRAQQEQPSVIKKKRNLPGNPDPDAEVMALSPKTLMARNRFLCEICNKGFQRDQNLQLHRRGHNLPWKLKQRSSKEVRKKVYICPEISCVHHDPTRALGDLTGIKKHFSRKHGEKKWKCEKCSKKYAVQSDWKAHSKTCGTREYRCDCGTLFSRRDSFITHRAFCDALAEETSRSQTTTTQTTNSITNNTPLFLPPQFPQPPFNDTHFHPLTLKTEQKTFTTTQPPQMLYQHDHHNLKFTNNIGPYYPPISTPHMSATALLQKAAQMGATMSQTNTNNNTAGFALNLSSSDKHMGKDSLTYGINENSVPLPPPPATTSTLSAGSTVVGTTSSTSNATLFQQNSVSGPHFFHDMMMMNSFEDEFEFGETRKTHHGNFKSDEKSGNGNGYDGLTRDFLGLRPLISQSDFLSIAAGLDNCIDHGDENTTFEENQNQKSWQGN